MKWKIILFSFLTLLDLLIIIFGLYIYLLAIGEDDESVKWFGFILGIGLLVNGLILSFIIARTAPKYERKKKKLNYGNGTIVEFDIARTFFRLMIFAQLSIWMFVIVVLGINTPFFEPFSENLKLAFLSALASVAFYISIHTVLDPKISPHAQLILSLRMLFYFAFMFLFFNAIIYLSKHFFG